MMPSLTFSVSLQAPCWGAHQPTPCVRPEMSLISLAWTHLPSSGMGAGPWYAPLATGHMFSTSCEYCMPLLSFVVGAHLAASRLRNGQT